MSAIVYDCGVVNVDNVMVVKTTVRARVWSFGDARMKTAFKLLLLSVWQQLANTYCWTLVIKSIVQLD